MFAKFVIFQLQTVITFKEKNILSVDLDKFIWFRIYCGNISYWTPLNLHVLIIAIF